MFTFFVSSPFAIILVCPQYQFLILPFLIVIFFAKTQKKMIITRKIELEFPVKNRNSQNEMWSFLHKLNDDVFHAANHIVNHQYFNYIYTQRAYFTDFRKIDIAIKEIKKLIKITYDSIKLKNFEQELAKLKLERKNVEELQEEMFKEEFGIGKQHSTYDIIKNLYPEMPSYILAALNYRVYKDFQANLFNVKIGKQTLRNYKKGIPIPFTANCVRFSYDKQGRCILKWVKNIRFYLQFGRYLRQNEMIVLYIMEGKFKACISSIQLKNDKVFLLLSVDIPNRVPDDIIPSLVVGVDLGLNIPAYCALSEGGDFLALGSRNDFLRVRIQMQVRRRRLLKSLQLTQGGKGKTKKLKALDRLIGLEKNFVNTYNHNISKKIIEFAQKHSAGIIKLEFLTIGQEHKNVYLLRNWSFFELQTLIKYKAERVGIQVLFVDAYFTSLQCAKCGSLEKGQRINQTTFVCKNLTCEGYKINISADYNAAVNIARSKKTVNKQADSAYANKII